MYLEKYHLLKAQIILSKSRALFSLSALNYFSRPVRRISQLRKPLIFLMCVGGCVTIVTKWIRILGHFVRYAGYIKPKMIICPEGIDSGWILYPDLQPLPPRYCNHVGADSPRIGTSRKLKFTFCSSVLVHNDLWLLVSNTLQNPLNLGASGLQAIRDLDNWRTLLHHIYVTLWAYH